jgi:alkanesulfonate monooxygenase SsuD/methylene tetrahydromethanopterin reductase-like flavin-dependent oxidoreductase (luciferase family)
MPLEFGIAVPWGPRKGAPQPSFLQDLNLALTHLSPFVRSIWVTDHFQWDDHPTHEAWTTLAYLAALYPTMRVGPMVLGQSYRNPALMAKMAATLQSLSNGRLVMAVGAGWKEDEYQAYGYDFPRAGVRIEQLEDALEIMTRLWKQPGQVTYHGKHYRVVDAWCEPKPAPVPKLIVGGGGEKTMLLAARFADGWNIPDAKAAAYADRLAVLRRHCEAIGRDFETMHKSWFGRIAVAPTMEAALALSDGVWTTERAIVGTPDQVLEQLHALMALGVHEVMCEVQGQTDLATLALLRDEVLAKL